MIEPPPALDHRWRDLAHAEEDAHLVDLDHAPVVAEVAADERRRDVDAGVVDQDVHAAVQFDGMRDGRGPVRLAGDVVVEVGAADLGRRPLALVVEHVGEDDVGAFLGEQPRLGGALPARAAADQHRLALEPAHGGLPLARRRCAPRAGYATRAIARDGVCQASRPPSMMNSEPVL